MGEISSAAEFFDKIIARLGAVNSSFNKDEFPSTTVTRLVELADFVDQYSSILNLRAPVESQLLDALVDFRPALERFRVGKDSQVQRLFDRKDFVEARKVFKTLLESKFYDLITPKEKGKPSPTTVWRRSAQVLERIIGI